MKRFLIVLPLFFVTSLYSAAQVVDSSTISITTVPADTAVTPPAARQKMMTDDVYNIKPGLDIPLTILLDGWSIYGMSVIYGRDRTPESEILALNKNNINSFDRPIANNYSEKSADLSDKFFYGSMPLPILLMLDKKMRKDGLKIGLLFLETMGTTGALYVSSAMIVNRFRPYAYNSEVPILTRTRGGAKNSFFAGHPAVVASSTFFMAKVISDYHPNMKNKWILYTLAGSATAATGLLRIDAGQHFKTDVITGVTIGTIVGILVPHLHKNNNLKDQRLSLMPAFGNGGTGFSATYKLGR